MAVLSTSGMDTEIMTSFFLFFYRCVLAGPLLLVCGSEPVLSNLHKRDTEGEASQSRLGKATAFHCRGFLNPLT